MASSRSLKHSGPQRQAAQELSLGLRSDIQRFAARLMFVLFGSGSTLGNTLGMFLVDSEDSTLPGTPGGSPQICRGTQLHSAARPMAVGRANDVGLGLMSL